MPNTSATGGYLAPSNTAPAADAALDDQLQAMVVGVTGLPAAMVRPRFQMTPPPHPDPAADWCALGVTRETPDANAWIGHDPAGQGSDKMQRHATLEVLCSFYGPAGQGNAGRLRDGLALPQNREALEANGLAFVGLGEILRAPDLLNQRWVMRHDLTLTLRRQIDRIYPVLNILSAPVAIHTDPEGRA